MPSQPTNSEPQLTLRPPPKALSCFHFLGPSSYSGSCFVRPQAPAHMKSQLDSPLRPWLVICHRYAHADYHHDWAPYASPLLPFPRKIPTCPRWRSGHLRVGTPRLLELRHASSKGYGSNDPSFPLRLVQTVTSPNVMRIRPYKLAVLPVDVRLSSRQRSDACDDIAFIWLLPH